MKRLATGTALGAAIAAAIAGGSLATAATLNGHGHDHGRRPGWGARSDRGLGQVRGTVVSYSATGGDVTGGGALVITTQSGATLTVTVDNLTRIRDRGVGGGTAGTTSDLVANARVLVAAELINTGPPEYLALRIVVLPAMATPSSSASASPITITTSPTP